MRDRKAATYLFGLEAEWLAEVYLRLKGYRILARRFSAAGGEIDLVAARGHTLVFVEVKARGSLDAARTAITPQKLHRIERAARAYLGRMARLPETIRLDGLYLAPGRLPRHEKAIAELRLM